jgi:hypothetical protein
MLNLFSWYAKSNKIKLNEGQIMFKWDELEALKEAALARDAYQEVIVYQNEQILRELKSMGWKLKEANEKNGI